MDPAVIRDIIMQLSKADIAYRFDRVEFYWGGGGRGYVYGLLISFA